MVWRCCQVSCLGPSVQWPSGASYQLYNYTWPPLLLIMETLCKKISTFEGCFNLELNTLMDTQYLQYVGPQSNSVVWSVWPQHQLTSSSMSPGSPSPLPPPPLLLLCEFLTFLIASDKLHQRGSQNYVTQLLHKED